MLVTNGQDCDSEGNLIVVKRSCLIPLVLHWQEMKYPLVWKTCVITIKSNELATKSVGRPKKAEMNLAYSI